MRDVFGPDADVTIGKPTLTLAPDADVIADAVPEPGSRTHGPVRFVLYAGDAEQRRRVGRLTADVRVVAAHVRTARAVPARARLGQDAVLAVRGDVGRQSFIPLPTIAAVIGAPTRRGLKAGEVVSAALVDVPALVRTGQDVTTIARIAGIEVRGRAIASQNGSLGDTVLVVNPESRKRLRARVVGAGTVEVLHVS